MIVTTDIGNYSLNGTVEITTVLSALFGVIILMLLLFLYVNRKWCFHVRRTGVHCCDEKYLSGKCTQKLSRKRRYENTSSDSEEDILRRLRLQQARLNTITNAHGINGLANNNNNYINSNNNNNNNSNNDSNNVITFYPNYGINQINPLSQNFNYLATSDLQHVTVTPRNNDRISPDDPLAIAEHGKVGVPSSHSECSSNDSVDASIDSHNGILVGDKKNESIKTNDTNISASCPLRDARLRTANLDFNKSTINGKNSSDKSDSSTPPRHDSLDSTKDEGDMPCNSNNNINKIHNKNSEDEPLFDTSDLRSLKSEDISLQRQSYGKSGSIGISLLYDAPMRKMTVHVLEARGVPTLGNGQQIHTQIRLLMLPNKKQKHKTKIRAGENPQYMESFLLHRVTPEEVNNMGLRVRLYGCERFRKERLIGEAYVSFATIDLELETNLWLPLEPRNTSSILSSSSDLLSLARSDSVASSTSMQQHGGVPELLLGLGYSGTTGRLTVEIVKGSQFRCLSLNKAPDTYVKMCLVSSIGQEISRAKTSTRRSQPNPLFKETFVFQVALFQLNDVTLMISVYARRNMKKNEMVGWFSMGLNSSGPEEVAHWIDMRDMAKGELLARWHILADS